jgi:alkylhydroperoxidase family enzyme
MPRIEPIAPSPDGNPVTNSLLARVMGRSPKVLTAFGGLDAAIRFHGRLPSDLLEAVRDATAGSVGCAYCASLNRADRPDERDVRTELAVAFAQMVAEDHRDVRDAHFDDLRKHFSEEEIVELVSFICLVAIAGQMFGSVMGLEAADAGEAGAYQATLARQSAKRAERAVRAG